VVAWVDVCTDGWMGVKLDLRDSLAQSKNLHFCKPCRDLNLRPLELQVGATSSAMLPPSAKALSSLVFIQILVYNWRERIWRIAGSAPTVDVTKQGCGLITDPITGRVNVLVTGGTTGPAGASVDVASTWIWDPITGQIKRMPDVPINVIAGNNLKVVEYNSYEDLVLQPDTGILYKFSIENGWTPISNQTPNLQDPAVFLVPKGLFKCI
jgi:hypothetical protein